MFIGRLKKNSVKKIKLGFRKTIAIKLALLHLLQLSIPYSSFALTGGPSQPEVQSFEPVGTSTMVDLFTGDFNYNIPLLDVGGYPINISYHSGISMDQEASWVGLGWNINPGVINRSMRGIPDEFKSDTIIKQTNMKPNLTFGIMGGIGSELAGLDFIKVGYQLGINYNNYNGIGMEQGLNISLSAGDKSKGSLTGGLGLNSSSNGGLTISPSLSYNRTIHKNEAGNGNGSLGLRLGTSFNSRGGLRQLTIGVGYQLDYARTAGTVNPDNESGPGAKMVGNITPGVSSRFNFGTPTFTPSVDLPMTNFTATGRFTVGAELLVLHPNAFVSGYFSSQVLAENTSKNPSFGYMHSEEGQKNNSAIMDFNRENDGGFTPNTLNMPITNYTYDVYGVSGQGIGGSYRPVRNDIGYVFDAESYSTSGDFSLSVELGVGNSFHAGGDVMVNTVNTYSKPWTNDNKASNLLAFRATGADDTYEKFYFKEASEKTVDQNANWIPSIGGYEPVRIQLKENSKYNVEGSNQFIDNNNVTKAIPSNNYKAIRDPRSQVISYLTWQEMADFGLVNTLNPSNYPSHHIAEISTLNPSGQRYVYGIPAYNKSQKEVTFAVGQTAAYGNGHTGDCQSGLVNYTEGIDNSMSNKLGIDNYYTSTTTPAYAHAYLLTSVLSNDYIDVDQVRGPSDNDFGSYTNFYYSKIPNYKWRTPFQDANYSEGLKSDKMDDKASYIYGEKELNYLDSIVTKNHIAIFYKDNREDGFGVKGEDGILEPAVAQKKLTKISLFSKPDYRKNGVNAVPLKEVHFEYDYTLCPGLPNNINNGGKLTLKKIYFTYQSSFKGKLNPYEFVYSDFNPSYNIKNYDRWGNYKPNPITGNCAILDSITTAEFPYAEQNQTKANKYASAWSLTGIKLPSGGTMNVEYESDDYAYVQNKRAGQMFKIVGSSPTVPNSSTNISTSPALLPLSNNSEKNHYLIFELQPGFTDIDEYFKDIDLLYFRFLMLFDNTNSKYDYVSGYADLGTNNQSTKGVVNIGGVSYGYIKIKSVSLGDNGSNADYNPICKAALQFGRLHLSKFIWDQPGISDNLGFGKQILDAIINSSFAKNIGETIKGPNKSIWDKSRGRDFIAQKSFFRLNNPNKKKLGGGCRVKKIYVNDEWSTMTQNQHTSNTYGQQYYYNLEDGTSSGVAAYEPQLGGDENSMKRPVFFKQENTLVPDEQFYHEEPFGEAFFPSPTVGYSMVTVKNLDRPNVSRHATGKTVHEYYTSKDFPTITKHTSVDSKHHKSDPFSLSSLFSINVKDYMTASQGYLVELNDMHGKEKAQKIFAENKTSPISAITYKYKQDPYLENANRLRNNAPVIDQEGNVSEKEIGVFVDVVADMRQQRTEMASYGAQLNLDAFFIPPFFFIPLPTVWPSYTSEATQFRSAVTTKVVQKFGMLEETIAEDLGSIISTKNIAYEANTGTPIINQVTTNFNDLVYNSTLPAYWFYDGMGLAYKNINLSMKNVSFNSSGIATVNNATTFAEGDELALSTGEKAWVTAVTANTIKLQKKDGQAVSGTFDIRVLKSGRKNILSADMATISTLTNPLNNIKNNIYENVLHASAIEYSQIWRTYCNCIDPSLTNNDFNSLILGVQGNWSPVRSHAHLAGRTQSNYNNQTNIRKDGVFTSFSPFYKLDPNKKWDRDAQNWTFISQITEYTPYGQELESKDALNIYSSAIFGYNSTIATAVGSNTRHRELGFDNFEDYDYNLCIDGHFKFPSNVSINNTNAHSGTKSLKVSSGTPVEMSKDIVACDFSDCNVVLNGADIGNKFVISVFGGTGPYEFDWEILSGSPTILPSINQNSIDVSGSSYSITVKVTDYKGCSIIKTYNK